MFKNVNFNSKIQKSIWNSSIEYGIPLWRILLNFDDKLSMAYIPRITNFILVVSALGSSNRFKKSNSPFNETKKKDKISFSSFDIFQRFF